MATLQQSKFFAPEENNLNQISPDLFLQKLFDKYDTNRDGRLAWFQFWEALKFLTKVTGATFPKRHDIEDIFTHIDHDGDTTISRDQYRKLTKNIIPLIENSGIKLLFKGKI